MMMTKLEVYGCYLFLAVIILTQRCSNGTMAYIPNLQRIFNKANHRFFSGRNTSLSCLNVSTHKMVKAHIHSIQIYPSAFQIIDIYGSSFVCGCFLYPRVPKSYSHVFTIEATNRTICINTLTSERSIVLMHYSNLCLHRVIDFNLMRSHAASDDSNELGY